MQRLARTLLLIVLGACALTAGGARAATDTGTVNVSATVPDLCVIGNATLAFGSYDPVVANVATPLDATATLSISCTGGTPWAVGLGDGANGKRQLRNGASLLAYELYRDAGHTLRWGDAALAERASGVLATTSTWTLTIYGRIPAGQMPGVGLHADIVTATVYF